MTTATVGRRSRLLSSFRLPRLTTRRVIALLAVVGLVAAGWFWLRASSLVAIKRVQVTGLSGPDVAQIRSALVDEALTMTTLDVSSANLANSVVGFSHIAGVTVSTHFPHGVTIAVSETIPLATLRSGGRTVAVDRAGVLLPQTAVGGLPSLPIAPDSDGARVTTAGTLATLSVLSAAPYQLLSHIASAKSTSAHGVVVQLRDGPALYFGDTTQLAVKWRAADGVLANSNSLGASYIDVSAPGRPAAGTGN